VRALQDELTLHAARQTADSIYQTPTGASLVATEQRAALLPAGTVTLPPLPNSNTTYVLSPIALRTATDPLTRHSYITQGLVTRPTFFGCNVTSSILNGNASDSNVPMLVYLPNNDNGLGITNTSTSQLVYPDDEATSFLDTASAIVYNGWENDAEWPTCLACAVVERTRGREGVDRTAACEKCFDKYCWSEVEADATGGGGGNSSTGGGGSSGGGNGTSSGGNGTTGGSGGVAPASGASRGGEWKGVNAAMALGVAGLALLWA
jgi:lysophospholipase